MARLALALYEAGRGPREVLREWFLCYRRSELAAGRSTVFSLDFSADQDDPITARPDSLLAALHKHHVANAAWVEAERRRTAGHSGGGLDDEDIEIAREYVADIEDLRRRVG